MAIFKEFGNDDIKSSKSYLNQLVDVLQEDISGSVTRKKTQIFVTGGVGPGVTSSMFQTVYDQDFTLQTANPVFDLTVGLYSGSTVVQNAGYTIDSAGKYLFPSQTLMMREKMDIYRQFAQSLLGNANNQFQLVSGSTSSAINEAMFVCYRRLFARDQIKRETYAVKMYVSASGSSDNLQKTAVSASIFTDISSSTNKEITYGGQVSTIVDSSNTSRPVGLLYVDKGIAVFDTSRVFASQVSGSYVSSSLRGMIQAVCSGGLTPFTGSFNQFLASGSIDDVIDHIATTRFSGSTVTAMTFQNVTNINSSLFFCRLGADEFNYSSNPTYTDSNNRIVVIDEGQEETQKSFTFVSSISMLDSLDNVLAVAKVSRPILKDSDRDLNIKIRLDF